MVLNAKIRCKLVSCKNWNFIIYLRKKVNSYYYTSYLQ